MFNWLQKVIQRRRHASAEELRMLLVLMVLFMVVALAFVWPNVKKVKLAYEYQTLTKVRRLLLRENNLLQLEIGSLQALDRIQTLAETKAGLQYPDNRQMVTVFLR